MNWSYSRAIASLSLVLVLSSCSSGYSSFYRPARTPSPELIASIRVGPPPAMPLVERAQPMDGQAILDAYGKRGFVMIGSSFFNTGQPESDSSAVSQGQKVGADLVLILNPKYTGSETSYIPITTPTSTTSYSSGSATAYGPGGPVTAYGSGTTTTYGSTTNYVPFTINKSDYGAIYFAKVRSIFGAFSRDLNDNERQELQTNKGAVIRALVNGSPAFNADILVGDIITMVDGIQVQTSSALVELLRERKGKQVSLSLIRRGQRIEKSVTLNP